MSTRAPRADSPHRHRPVTIRAAFVPCHDDMRFCLRCGQAIWTVRPATDHLNDVIARMAGLIATSGPRATIQIPIAMLSSLTTLQRPAVSSLEASPTPAH